MTSHIRTTGSRHVSREWVARKFPDSAQWPRIQRLLWLAGAACVLHGSLWFSYYATHGMFAMAWVLLALVLVGIACFVLVRRLDRSWLVIISHALLLLTLLAAAGDAPSATSTRSVHLFLTPIGVAAFFLFRSQGLYLKWIFPGLCLLAQMVLTLLSSVTLGVEPGMMPADVHQLSHVMNTLTATGLTAGVLVIFREDLRAQAARYAALARALSQQELVAYLQPQVAADGTVTGAELLLRWDRPRHGLQSPADFIPLAEETGLIHEIGLWVMEQACLTLSDWSQQRGLDALVLSVNVSPLQLGSDTFVSDVRAILQQTGAPPHRLKLEITESVLSANLAQTAIKMEALRETGIRWSLDDFGTGFSSLSLLGELPLDELKIDRAFVRDVVTQRKQRDLVQKIIEIARIHGMSAVAEGVETPEQHACVALLGCKTFQGYLFGKPMTLQAFVEANGAGVQRH